MLLLLTLVALAEGGWWSTPRPQEGEEAIRSPSGYCGPNGACGYPCNLSGDPPNVFKGFCGREIVACPDGEWNCRYCRKSADCDTSYDDSMMRSDPWWSVDDSMQARSEDRKMKITTGATAKGAISSGFCGYGTTCNSRCQLTGDRPQTYNGFCDTKLVKCGNQWCTSCKKDYQYCGWDDIDDTVTLCGSGTNCNSRCHLASDRPGQYTGWCNSKKVPCGNEMCTQCMSSIQTCSGGGALCGASAWCNAPCQLANDPPNTYRGHCDNSKVPCGFGEVCSYCKVNAQQCPWRAPSSDTVGGHTDRSEAASRGSGTFGWKRDWGEGRMESASRGSGTFGWTREWGEGRMENSLQRGLGDKRQWEGRMELSSPSGSQTTLLVCTIGGSLSLMALALYKMKSKRVVVTALDAES